MRFRSTSHELAAAAVALAVAILPGCAAPQPASAPDADEAAFAPNPTAARLQDLAGSILLFYGAYDRLPASLEELKLATGLRQNQIIDPVTDRPFVYVPAGVAASSEGRRIVLLAAPPPGSQTCFGVSISSATGGLLADVATFPAGAYETMQVVRPHGQVGEPEAGGNMREP